MKEINLAMVSDRNVQMGMLVNLYTALMNINPDYKLNIYILEHKLKPDFKTKLDNSLKKLNKSYSLTFLNLGKQYLDQIKVNNIFNRPAHINALTYARFFIPEILPKDIKFCLYLDCDIYVNKDISEIEQYFKYDTYPIFAGKDILVTRPDLYEEYDKRNLDINSEFFNAGVLIYNLDLWRQNNFAKECIKLNNQHPKLNCDVDQGIMNIILHSNWYKLDQSWNTMNLSESVLGGKYIKNNAILHYAGKVKPWRRDYDYEQFKLFYDILEKTEFKNWRPPFDFGIRYLKKKISSARNLFNSTLKQLVKS